MVNPFGAAVAFCRRYREGRPLISTTAIKEWTAEALGSPVTEITNIGSADSYRIGTRTGPCKAFFCLNGERFSHISRIAASAPEFFPVIIAKNRKWNLLLSEWIEGRAIRDGEVDLLAAAQAKLHSIASPGVKPYHRPFGILTEIFLPRVLALSRARLSPPHARNIRRVCANILAQLKELMRFLEPRVGNFDFTPSNLILTSESNITSIDNQFLVFDIGWEFDVERCRSRLSVHSQSLGEKFLAERSSAGDLGTYFRYRDFWEAIEFLRVAGKRLSLPGTDPRSVLPLLEEIRKRTHDR